MISLNLPPYDYKTMQQHGKATIFDPIRKKYVALTPEEWVRQHFVNYLITHLSYPRSLVNVENGLTYNQMQRRSDIVVYNRQGQPFVLIECKAHTVAIKPQVFEQIALYNYTLKAKFIVITNGMQHYCCRIDHQQKTYHFEDGMPVFGEG